MQQEDNGTILKRHMKYTFYLLAVFVLGWGFTTYDTAFLGLIVGSVTSFYNHWLLYRKVNKFGETVVTGGKMYSLGTVSRMAAAGLAVFISLRYPEYINVYFVIVGLMTSYLVIFIDFMIQSKKQTNV
ncbi:ATP synthase subunit I [Litchfieldia salsa]|uniref:ATP synthase protein I n=1 Tax=Litchfieldia salsa TaxID=930152 RepID=A0A1H0U416_9BACI|nr:ATP synthase subunit I [Litchfieldia salsa]SDP60914.1 ATP synthase protein I [Litchfieldia salsa]